MQNMLTKIWGNHESARYVCVCTVYMEEFPPILLICGKVKVVALRLEERYIADDSI